MIVVRLTRAQRSAVEIYLTDEAHADDYPEVVLAGPLLRLDCTRERAGEILVDAANSADAGDGRTPDRGAAVALTNLLEKLRAST